MAFTLDEQDLKSIFDTLVDQIDDGYHLWVVQDTNGDRTGEVLSGEEHEHYVGHFTLTDLDELRDGNASLNELRRRHGLNPLC